MPGPHGTYRLLEPGTDGAPLVVLNTFPGEGDGVLRALQALTTRPFALAEVAVADWNGDLTPWPAPGVGHGEPPFAGGAEAHLTWLVDEVLPALTAQLGAPPAYVGLAGYSLAGLFAAWAPFRTAAFSRVACASGSLWYPGFTEFVQGTAPATTPVRAAFSLGDTEAKTRHPLMRTVADATEQVVSRYRQLGCATAFAWNPGNHFREPEMRMARAIAAMLED